jgi:hypothetical protein
MLTTGLDDLGRAYGPPGLMRSPQPPTSRPGGPVHLSTTGSIAAGKTPLAYFAVLVCAPVVSLCAVVPGCSLARGLARLRPDKLISVVIVCHYPPDKGGSDTQ